MVSDEFSEPHVSGRGFRAFDPVYGSPARSAVVVFESSLATEPAVWLRAIDEDGAAAVVSLPLAAAVRVGQQLLWFGQNHYQLGRPSELCAACDGLGERLSAAGVVTPCGACSGIARGPARWDMGSGEPPEEVQAVLDYTAEGEGEDSPHWGRTRSGWKGYKDGGKVYLDWPELVRRWGPVAEGRP